MFELLLLITLRVVCADWHVTRAGHKSFFLCLHKYPSDNELNSGCAIIVYTDKNNKILRLVFLAENVVFCYKLASIVLRYNVKKTLSKQSRNILCLEIGAYENDKRVVYKHTAFGCFFHAMWIIYTNTKYCLTSVYFYQMN